MVVVGFNQELPKFISRRMIRSKSDRDPGFVTWEEKGMAENGRSINKKGRNDW